MLRSRALHSLALLTVLMPACSTSTVMPRDGGPPPPPPGGGPCGANVGCPGDFACVESPRFPDGYCSAECSDAACPTGTRCNMQFGAALCLAQCAGPADCRTGYECWRGVCQPTCTSDAECGGGGAVCEAGACAGPMCTGASDCPSGQACMDGRCVAPTPDAGVGLPDGQPCTASSACTSGVCLPASRGGTCAPRCARRADCGGGVCVPVATSPSSIATACAPAGPGAFPGASCTRDDECQSLVCTDGECIEVCRDQPDCLLGQVCGTRTFTGGGTYPACSYAPITGVTVTDLELFSGQRDVNVGFGSTFAVPSDAVSVTFLARTSPATVRFPIIYTSVTSPAGTRLFDINQLVMYRDQPIRWLTGDSEEIATLLYPNSTRDRVVFLPGRTLVEAVMAADTGTADVRLVARIKRAPGGNVTSGVLNLNVFGTLSQTALDELSRVYAQAGITLGMVRTFPAPAGAFTIIDTADGPDSELAQLFRTSASAPEDAINIFLVRQIDARSNSGGGITLGIAGGIPGAPGVNGTQHSGVAIAAGTIGSSRMLGDVIAHEVGHFLGLFHPTESVGPCAANTGPTAANPCAPFGGGDVLADTAYGDQRNLMFWASNGGTTLSAGQGFVMLRNPVVR